MELSRESEWLNVLGTWGALGAQVVASRSKAVSDWSAAQGMIEAVRPKMEADANRLQLLLEESRKKLAPLGEPFDLDLGVHRWLDGEREEAYSDWLEWVVRQAKTPDRVFRIFGLEPPVHLPQHATLHMKREVCVAHGHVDQEGRLDLVVYFGDEAILVVEVKKGDAEDADTAKHAGYKQCYLDAKRVLLVLSAEEEDYEGFQPCSWEEVCIEVRRLAIGLQKDGQIMAGAMVLAFAAAVEQNLLGFSAIFVQRICERKACVFNSTVVDYIEKFLAYDGGSNGCQGN